MSLSDAPRISRGLQGETLANAGAQLMTEWASGLPARPGDRKTVQGRMIPGARGFWFAQDGETYSADGLASDAFACEVGPDDTLIALQKPKSRFVVGGLAILQADETMNPLVREEGYQRLYGLDVPKATQGLWVHGTGAITEERTRVHIPVLPGLVAHHEPKNPPKYDSRVYEIDGDGFGVFGGLSGLARVRRLPAATISATDGEYQVAYNLAHSGGEPTGYGATIQRLSGASINPNRITSDDETRTVILEAQSGLAMGHLASQVSGPISPGLGRADPHVLALNDKDEPLLPNSIWTGALYSNETDINAPMDFEEKARPLVKDRGMFAADVHLQKDRRQTHIQRLPNGSTRVMPNRWDWHVWQVSTPINPPNLTPSTNYSPLDREGPGVTFRPRPCLTKGEGTLRPTKAGEVNPDGSVSLGDDFETAWQGLVEDYEAEPRVGKFLSAGKRKTALADETVVPTHAPDYTTEPVPSETGQIQESIAGTADGVVLFAPPELEDHEARWDQTPAAPTLSDATFGLYGTSTLAFGKYATDYSTIVDGWRIFQAADGDLQIQGVDTTGATDGSTVDFLNPIVLGTMTAGSVLFAGTGGLVSEDNANLFYADATNRLGVAVASAPLDTIHAGGDVGIGITNSGNTPFLYFRSTAATYAGIRAEITGAGSGSETGDLQFHTITGGALGERVVIKSDGNTIINRSLSVGDTTNPGDNNAHIAGSLNVGTTDDPGAGGIVHDGATFVQGTISPTEIGGGTTNDWNPTGLATTSVIRFVDTATRTFTGITAPSVDGQDLLFFNTSTTQSVWLNNEDASSTAANRIITGRGSSNLMIPPTQSVRLWYDTTSNRWRVY